MTGWPASAARCEPGFPRTRSQAAPDGLPSRGPADRRSPRTYPIGRTILLPACPTLARPAMRRTGLLAISTQVNETMAMGDHRLGPEADRILVAQLTGEARHHA